MELDAKSLASVARFAMFVYSEDGNLPSDYCLYDRFFNEFMDETAIN